MSTVVIAECWGMQMPPTPKAVLISLADNANDEGHCWPSIQTICERTCLSRRAVINAIAYLEEVGALYADRTNGRHTKYVVTPDNFTGEVAVRKRNSGVGLDAYTRKKRAERAGEPVQQEHGCTTCTGAADALDQCTTCTGPVHQVHTNHKEPSGTERERKRSTPVRFSTWLESLPAGHDAIPADDPVFQFAADAGIPEDLLALAWAWFARTYTGARKAKRYTDWRQVFRNSVEGNWSKVWRFTPDGSCVLTSEGEMLRRALEAEARRAAA